MKHPSQPFLTANGLTKHFDGVQALKDARFELLPGEVHALMGENGAGKSTFGKILAGVLRPDSGSITLDGKPFRPSNPQRAQEAGVAMIFQELDLFPELTVGENIAIGNHSFRESLWSRHKELECFCRPYLNQVGLHLHTRKLVADLPIGQQQLLAIARALSMQAKILVMDESTSSLTDDTAENLFRLIGQLKNSGVATIYVSHKMDEIFRVCDRVTVLRDGQYIGTRTTKDTDADELIHMMVGRQVNMELDHSSHIGTQELFEANSISTRRLNAISFSLNRGEVLGLAGLVGAGRTEVGRAIFGLDPLQSGEMKLRGQKFTPSGPRNAMRYAVGFVPEDRKSMGLMMQMSVKENMTVATLFQKQRFGIVDSAAENTDYEALRIDTKLKTATPNHAISTLSGGNQQKTLLARWLMLAPEIVFLDDPTRGVDVGAKEDIYGLIEKLASEGRGVIMVSSELSELLRCCDRILVLNEGQLTADLSSQETSQAEIMHYAATPLAQLQAAG